MKNKIFLLLLILILSACQSQSAPPPEPIESPAEVSLPTATISPTEIPLPTEALAVASPETVEVPTDLFCSVNSADVQPGFMLNPVVSQIFEGELQKLVDLGSIEAFQVEGLSVLTREDGSLFAEIFYALKATQNFWPDDFGTLGEDGWVNGKCTIFDFIITDEEYQLKNKRVCS